MRVATGIATAVEPVPDAGGKYMLRLLSIGALLSVGLIGSAQAQTLVFNYNARDTAKIEGTSGSFTLEKNGGTLNVTSFSGKVGGVQYSLSDVAWQQTSASNQIQFGGNANGVVRLCAETDDFFFSFNLDKISDPATAVYITSGTTKFMYEPIAFVQAAAPVAAAVPEPASWAMMIGGFGVIGGGLRTRRRAVKFVAA